jgi:hypothetical protein
MVPRTTSSRSQHYAGRSEFFISFFKVNLKIRFIIFSNLLFYKSSNMKNRFLSAFYNQKSYKKVNVCRKWCKYIDKAYPGGDDEEENHHIGEASQDEIKCRLRTLVLRTNS